MPIPPVPVEHKEGALVQLVNNSIPSARPCLTSEVLRLVAIVAVYARAVELNGLREVLITVSNSFANCLLCIVRTTLGGAQVQGCDINQSGLNPDDCRQVRKRYDACLRYCCGTSST
jgi:hypothetical protein